jgi:hypothetical protein
MNPAEDFSMRARAFHGIHGGQPTQGFAANLHARVELIQAGETTLPVVINDASADSAWTCSPRTTYSDCASEEAARNLPGWLALPVRGVATAVGSWLARVGLDRVAVLNHWLLSTDLYPTVTATPLQPLIDESLQRWPGHALWCRSLNAVDHADWLAALGKHGFQLVASRQVYLYEGIARLASRHSHLKRDLAGLQRTPLQRADNDSIVDADYARIARLYELLYLEKYSRFNPRYNARFMREWHHAGLLEFHGFRDASGLLLCVVGLFRQGATITSPIVGYDTALPQKLGLYRLLSACAFELAARNDYRFNYSAGAAQFKRLRGGQPAIEYSAFYTRHLPRPARRATAMLSQVTRQIGVPLLTRYEL